MAEQRDRAVKHLNHAVKSGSGHHHASSLRRYTRYVIDSFFNCCIGIGYCCCCCCMHRPIKSYSHACGGTLACLEADFVELSLEGTTGYGGGTGQTFNNNNEFGRNTNTPELFSTIGPLDVVYGPKGGTACYGGGGTGQTNQPVSVSTSSNHPNMNSSDYSKKNQRLTINGNRTGTQDDNISTISQRSIIDDAKANETPIVVKERVSEKVSHDKGLKKWLCLGWLANKR